MASPEGQPLAVVDGTMVTEYALATPGALSLLLAGILGGLVYFKRPERPQNRWLAFTLVIGASTTAAFVASHIAPDPSAATGFLGLFVVLVCILPLAYAGFLSTLDSPFAAPLRRTPGRIAILTYTVGALSLVFLHRELFVEGLITNPWYSGWQFREGPLLPLIGGLAVVITYLYGLLVAITAWRRARTPRLRQQAGLYALAFGVRDALFALALILLVFVLDHQGAPFAYLNLTAYAVIDLLFALLLAYGILKAQIFSVDLKIKWTIKKSTLAAVFLLVFFVTAQVAQAFLTTAFGWAIGGIVAGLLLFAIAPLQRFAERVSDAAMPRVQDTEEYRTVRVQDLYQAALEEMLADGTVDAKERRTLVRLQEQLGLDAATAQALEMRMLDSITDRGGVG